MRPHRLILLMVLFGVHFLGALVPALSAPRRIALVIGNAAYQEGRLRNPVNDATDMAANLRQLGFHVTLLRDVQRPEMDGAIDTFSRQLRQGGVGLFYFAGHGVQVAGENYLIPLGARLVRAQDVRYQAVPVGQVLGALEDADNGLNIMILDACRNNPFARSWRSRTRGLVAVQAVEGSLIAYATAPGSVAADGDGRNGLYTQHLLHAMTIPGLSVEQMFKRVRVAVRKATAGKQTPWESSSLTGDFAFQLAPSPPPPIATASRPQPAAGGPPALSSQPNPEAEMWVLVKDSSYAEDFKDFLAAYPQGRYAPAARLQLKRLQRQQQERQQERRQVEEVQPTPSPPPVQVARLDPNASPHGVNIGRFITYDNGTALDTKTNLVWMARDFHNIEGRAPKDWDEAMAWVAKMNQQSYGGYRDWRVPTDKEYKQIVTPNARNYYPAAFQDKGGSAYWTAERECSRITLYSEEDCVRWGASWEAYNVDFRTGRLRRYRIDRFSRTLSVRLVRSRDQ